MQSKYHNIKKTTTVAETGLTLALTSLNVYAHEVFKAFGEFFFPALALFDLIKFVTYWRESGADSYKKTTRSLAMSRLFYGLKLSASISAVALGFTVGVATALFVILGASYLRAVRAGYRCARNLIEGELTKAKDHGIKFLVSLLLSAGPTLVLFFPPLAVVGWGLVMLAGGIIFGKATAKISEIVLSSVSPVSKSLTWYVCDETKKRTAKEGLLPAYEAMHRKDSTFIMDEALPIITRSLSTGDLTNLGI